MSAAPHPDPPPTYGVALFVPDEATAVELSARIGGLAPVRGYPMIADVPAVDLFETSAVILAHDQCPEDLAAAALVKEAAAEAGGFPRIVRPEGWTLGTPIGAYINGQLGDDATPHQALCALVEAPAVDAGPTGGFVGFVSAPPGESPKFEGDPRPLAADLLPVPPLDPRMIPEALRGWLLDIARRACLPLEFPVITALVALGSLVGKRLAIRPKRRDDWTVVPNLWGGIVGLPGVMKSPAVEEALRPLKRLVADALRRHEEARQAHNDGVMVAEARAVAAKDALRKAAKAGRSEEELRRLAAEARPPEAGDGPTARRHIVNDTTVEKLGELLGENPNGLLLFRDELMGWLRTLERQGHEADRAFFLEAWSGLGSYVYDRIGRGTLHIENVCVSLFGSIQPGPLARYLRGAASGEEADGLVPRFQLLVYPNPPAEFVNHDEWPDAAAKSRAYAVFEAFDGLDAAARGCPVDDERRVPTIGFDPEAQDLFDGWRCELENRLRSGHENVLMTCHLAKYRSLMPSLALLFHLIETVGQPGAIPPVSHAAAAMAAAWCDFLEAHARRLYQTAFDGDPDSAERLADRIKQSLPNPFTIRHVARKGWAGLTHADDVRRAVGLLEDRGWVKVVEVPAGPQGGRPTEHVWVHPKLLGNGPTEGVAS